MKRFTPLFLAALLAIPVLAQASPAHPPDSVLGMTEAAAIVHVLPAVPAFAHVGPELTAIRTSPVLASLDLSNLFSSDNIAWAVGSLLSLLAGISGIAKWLTANRRKWIGVAAHDGFLIVEDLKSNGVNVPDKVLAGLKAADDWLTAHGFRTLSAQEQEAVKLKFKALNGATVVAASAAPAVVPSKPAAA